MDFIYGISNAYLPK